MDRNKIIFKKVLTYIISCYIIIYVDKVLQNNSNEKGIKMIRKSNEIIYVDEILKPEYFSNIGKGTPKRFEIRGDMVKLGQSLRLRTFYNKGNTCVKCGIKAKYFVKEKSVVKDLFYHLNLYGIDESGEEVLFTHDHIIPKSKGGKDNDSNTQTMCCYCNWEKADKIEIK